MSQLENLANKYSEERLVIQLPRSSTTSSEQWTTWWSLSASSPSVKLCMYRGLFWPQLQTIKSKSDKDKKGRNHRIQTHQAASEENSIDLPCSEMTNWGSRQRDAWPDGRQWRRTRSSSPARSSTILSLHWKVRARNGSLKISFLLGSGFYIWAV